MRRNLATHVCGDDSLRRGTRTFEVPGGLAPGSSSTVQKKSQQDILVPLQNTSENFHRVEININKGTETTNSELSCFWCDWFYYRRDGYVGDRELCADDDVVRND